MADISPPVQEALSALERLQADAYRRGWQDAMVSVANFATTARSGLGSLEVSVAKSAAGEGKQPRVRGPNRNSLPSRILALLDNGPIDMAAISPVAQAVIANESMVNIKRAISRLIDSGHIVMVGSTFVRASAAPTAATPNNEIPEAPTAPGRSGLFTASDDREHHAAA